MDRPAHESAPAGDFTQWLDEARRGSPEALGRLLQAYRGYLLVIAHSSLNPKLRARTRPSDVVQGTLARATEKFAQFAGGTEAELKGWLRKVLLNHLARLWEKEQAAKNPSGHEIALEKAPPNGLIDPGGSPSARVIAQDENERLRWAVQQLPAKYRLVIEWHHFEGVRFEEIGERLGRSARTASRLWTQALEQLRQILGSSDEFSGQ
jgi:RNA polymerase sigma-70 factor (ECF subfamily)